AVGRGVPSDSLKKIQRNRVSALLCPTKKGRIDLAALTYILGEMNITSILLEGGSSLIGAMIRERLIDKFYIFKASMILGGNDGIPMASGPGPKKMDECLRLKDIKVKRFGDDILVMGYPDYSSR
ncbi:MAG: dihydrofolate reductase family protein, partial [Desulfatiglandales bacterium]|nr:dihydrofolate reductase family protein [Desulfatiglandales bacterium]